MSTLRRALSISVLAAATALPAASHSAAIGFSLSVIDSDTVVSSLPGVGITNLEPDHWSIDLGLAGITVTAAPGFFMTWKEDEPSTLVNRLIRTSDTTLELFSNFDPTGLDTSCGLAPAPLEQGATCLIGRNDARDDFYITVIDATDTAARVPVPATLGLLGLGLAGLGWSRRKQQ